MKLFVLLLLLVLTANNVARAENTTYKQQILPIDCVYEVIDVGTQKLRYLTPETCPIDPGPPVITEPSGETPETTPGTKWVYIAPIEVAPPPENNKSDTIKEEVKGSTERIRDVVYKNKDSMIIIGLITVLWAAVIIILKRRNTLN